MRSPSKKLSPFDFWFESSIQVFMVLLAIVMLVPFLNIAAISVSEGWAVTAGKVGIVPVGFQVETLTYILTTPQFSSSLLVSIFVTALGTGLSLLVTVLAAYPLSKKHLPGMKGFILVFVFTMLFSGGLIPSYLLVKSLGLLNTPWALMFPMTINVFNLLVIKSFLEGLPESLEESAIIEGAGNLTVLFRIILPLSAPVLATVGLFYSVSYWNDFFSPLIYVSSASLKTLQLYLREVVADMASANVGLTMDFTGNLSPDGIRSSLIIAATVPIVLVYPFLQKYFTKGVLIGSVKG